MKYKFKNLNFKHKYNKHNLIKLSTLETLICKSDLKITDMGQYYYDFGWKDSENLHKYQDPFFFVKSKQKLLKIYFNTLVKFKENSQNNKYLMIRSSVPKETLFFSKEILFDKMIDNWENLIKIYFFNRCFNRGLIRHKKRGGYSISLWEFFNTSFLPKSHSIIQSRSSNKSKRLIKAKIKKNLLHNTTYPFEVLSVFKRKKRRWVHFKQNLSNKNFFNYSLSNVISLKRVPYPKLEQKLFFENKKEYVYKTFNKKQLIKFNSEIFALKTINIFK